MSSKKNVFGTKEWAIKNINFINGCQHNCKYCYSKEMAIRFNRKTAENWKNEELRINDLKKNYKYYEGRVMFPSSHDITPDHLNEAIIILDKIIRAGNEVLIVSKPHFECISAICEKFDNFKKKILFRFTIGSSNNSVLKFWEPGAPSFQERLKCLKYAYNSGFETSISCEPMLDFEVEKLIEIVKPFVTNSIWIGKANFLLKRMKSNGITDELSINKAYELYNWQMDKSNILSIFNKFKDDSLIKWKDSMKKMLNIEKPEEEGLDI